MKKVFVTNKMPDKIIEELRRHFEIDYFESDDSLSESELANRASNADAIFCPLSTKITEDIIDAGKNLKIIANFGAGFDNIDHAYAKEKNIPVTNTPAKSSTTSTSEYAVGLILAATRRMVSGDKMLREGKFIGWKPTFYLGNELDGKTVGIIGMGSIGTRVAKLLKAFGVNLIYYNRTRLDEKLEKELDIKYMELDDVISNSDIITLHLSFSSELHHLIDMKKMKMMKPDAILINAARGPLIDEAALVDALEAGMFRAVALDVYEFEPKVTEGLLKYDRVILSPHLGNTTVEAREEMGFIAVDNIKDVLLNNAEPRNKIN